MRNDARLIFLRSNRFEEGEAIRGGILVTDEETKPLEFRCTGPIRPTALQKMLYGNMLQRHVLVELIGHSLLNSINEKSNVVLVREPDLLHLQVKVGDQQTVLLLSKHGEFDAKTEGKPGGEESATKLLGSDSGRFEPVVVRTYRGFEEKGIQLRGMLREVFAHFDLIEPFERIKVALEHVHKQKLGESK